MRYHLLHPWSSEAPSVAPRLRPRRTEIESGLRQHLLQVYDYMACGLVLTGVFAYLVARSGFHAAMMEEVPFLLPFLWILLLAPLALAMLFWLEIDEMSFIAAEAIFWAYAAYVGFSLGCISLVYTGASIAPACFVAAGTFAAMSAYGYATRADLSKPGNLLAMGVVGAVLAGIVNIYLASSPLQLVLCVMGVVALVALTAWDSQRIKDMYLESASGGARGRNALMGALALYFDANPVFLILRLESRAASKRDE
jgi:FtsH-binding integral membrane protein